MKGLNKVQLIGNLGQDPETITYDTGASASRISVATSESYTKKDGTKVDNVEWHRVIAWNKLSEIFERYLKKGDKVYIEGSLITRTYEKDGVTMYYTEVVARNLIMLGSKTENKVDHAGSRFADMNEILNGDIDDLPY